VKINSITIEPRTPQRKVN